MRFILFASILSVGLFNFANAACAGSYAQCGGNNFSGEKCCEQGLKCVEFNEWYSQCLPDNSGAQGNAAPAAKTLPNQNQNQPAKTLPNLNQNQPAKTLPNLNQNQPAKTLPNLNQNQPAKTLPNLNQNQPAKTLPNLNQNQPAKTLPNLNQNQNQPAKTLPNLNQNQNQPAKTLPNLNQNQNQPAKTLPNLNQNQNQPTKTLPNFNQNQPAKTLPSFNQNQNQPAKTLPSFNQNQNQPAKTLPNLNQNQNQPAKTLPSLNQNQNQPAKTLPSFNQNQNQPAKTLPSFNQNQNQPAKTLPSFNQNQNQPAKTLPSFNQNQNQPAKTLPSFNQNQNQPAKTLPSFNQNQNQPAKTLPSFNQNQNQPAKTLPNLNQNQNQPAKTLPNLNQNQNQPAKTLPSFNQNQNQPAKTLPNSAPAKQTSAPAPANNSNSGNFFDNEIYANPKFIEEIDSSISKLSGDLKGKAEKVKNVPTAVWLAWEGAPGEVAQHLEAAGSKTVVFIMYMIPTRDCNANASAGGASNLETYKGYVNSISNTIKKYPNSKVVMVLEPDTLGNLVTANSENCKNVHQLHKDALSYGVSVFGNMSNVSVYLDAAHGAWLGSSTDKVAAVVKEILSNAQNGKIRGLSTNVSNYQPVASEYQYHQKLASALSAVGIQNMHFIVDTGRNGAASSGTWCNLIGTGFGERPKGSPSPSMPLLDAYMWLKTPGEADGSSTGSRADPECAKSNSLQGAPDAGQWFHDYFVQLLKNAKPGF
ncbi:1, 4-beta cellobiohydrolase [Neocallimastix sp. 'constans']